MKSVAPPLVALRPPVNWLGAGCISGAMVLLTSIVARLAYNDYEYGGRHEERLALTWMWWTLLAGAIPPGLGILAGRQHSYAARYLLTAIPVAWLLAPARTMDASNATHFELRCRTPLSYFEPARGAVVITLSVVLILGILLLMSRRSAAEPNAADPTQVEPRIYHLFVVFGVCAIIVALIMGIAF